MVVEGDSVLWIAGYDNPLTRFSLNTHQFEHYGGMLLYWKMIYDKNGKIWCANNEGLLDQFDPVKRTFIQYRFDSLTEKAIYFDLDYDAEANLLWVTTSNGLLKFHTENHSAQLYTEKDGLPTNHLAMLERDNLNRLWISTNH